MGVTIRIDNVTKRYGNNTVIQGLSTDIKAGEFFTLLGPSGCGKTTLLRMIIGFNSIEEGEILVDGKLINGIPTNKRNMGMVFQNYAVFPHMTVKENVAYGLKTRKVQKAEMDRKVDEMLKLIKIEEYKHRMPSQLSGGQQQRVALARAIVIQPEVLLMDEPLSNLDAKLRVEMRNVIKRIQRQINITTVYVTHDQEEALAISDRIAVMDKGIIQQIDTPKRIYQRPSNLFVSTFIGLSNILEGSVHAAPESWQAQAYGYRFTPPPLKEEGLMDGQRVLVSVRPEEFLIAKEGEPGIPAIVRSSVFLGVNLHYFLELPDGKEVEVIAESDLSEIIPDNTPVSLQMVQHKINLFHQDSRQTLIREGA
jgi:iron(III) transport system ATP-binding protein